MFDRFLMDIELRKRMKTFSTVKRDTWVLENLITCEYCEHFKKAEYSKCQALPKRERREGIDKKCTLFLINKKYIPNIVEFEKMMEDKRRSETKAIRDQEVRDFFKKSRIM